MSICRCENHVKPKSEMLNIERFVCNMFQENCYVVSDESADCVIIDCGAFYDEEQAAIARYIDAKALRPVHLVATHGHIDHNYGNGFIFSRYAIAPEVHEADERLMNSLNEQSVMFIGIPVRDALPPVRAYLRDGDTIAFGSHSLSVISTPGHSVGSVFLYCEQEGLAFSGDTLFSMSIGRTDLETGSYNDIMKSLAAIADRLPCDTLILPGHGPKTTLADEKRRNPYLR